MRTYYFLLCFVFVAVCSCKSVSTTDNISDNVGRIERIGELGAINEIKIDELAERNTESIEAVENIGSGLHFIEDDLQRIQTIIERIKARGRAENSELRTGT